jgi:hypothetical protein
MLSLISGKRAHYLMGMLPALALLGARALEPSLGRAGARFGTWPAALLMIAVGVGLFAVPAWAARGGAPPWATAIPAWLGALPMAIGAAWAFGGRRIDHRVLALAFGSVLFCGGALVGFVRLTAPAYDVTPAAQRIAVVLGQGVPVAVVGDYHGQFQFAGRLREPLPVLRRDAVAGWLALHPQGRLVVNVRQLPGPASGDTWMYRGGWLVLADAEAWRQLAPRR